MANTKLEDLFSTTLSGIRNMVDVDTIIGNPIETQDGVMVVPVSKVSFGFGIGGWGNEKDELSTTKVDGFAGGSGGGVTVNPVAFLVIKGSEVKILNIDATTPFDKIVDNAPSIINSIASIFKKD